VMIGESDPTIFLGAGCLFSCLGAAITLGFGMNIGKSNLKEEM
jgi:hypothetical protein